MVSKRLRGRKAARGCVAPSARRDRRCAHGALSADLSPTGRAVEVWINPPTARATGKASPHESHHYCLRVLTGSARGVPLRGAADYEVGNSGAASSPVPLGEHATSRTDGIEDRRVDDERWAQLMSLVDTHIE